MEERRIVEQHRVGSAGNLQIVLRIVGAIDQTDEGSEVPAGRTSARGDARGINSEFPRMAAHPAHRGLRIFAGAEGSLFAVVGDQTILDLDADDATSDEVFALRIKLTGPALSDLPATAMKEDDGGTAVARFPVRRIEDVELQLAVAYFLIHVRGAHRFLPGTLVRGRVFIFCLLLRFLLRDGENAEAERQHGDEGKTEVGNFHVTGDEKVD